jgi:hypothetical protein
MPPTALDGPAVTELVVRATCNRRMPRPLSPVPLVCAARAAAQVLQCICKTCSRLLLPDSEKRKWSRWAGGAGPRGRALVQGSAEGVLGK